MPETEKDKLSTRTEKPAPDSGSSNKKNTAAADGGGYSGSPAEVEIGGSKGLEPTRFGDWEKNGRCTDF